MILKPSARNHVPAMSCPDGTGVVAAITGFITMVLRP